MRKKTFEETVNAMQQKEDQKVTKINDNTYVSETDFAFTIVEKHTETAFTVEIVKKSLLEIIDKVK